MDKLVSRTCTEFTAALASKASVPGGGGAAAVTGALAAALCAMVGNYTLGKKKYAAYEDDIKDALVRADMLRGRLLELVDEDAAAFAPLSRAYALAKDDPERGSAIEDGSRVACKAPMEILELSCQVVELCEELLEKGSKLLLSDAGCAAVLARAAMESAALNIYVNTASLQNRTVANIFDQKADGLLARFIPRAEAVTKAVSARIRKG